MVFMHSFHRETIARKLELIIIPNPEFSMLVRIFEPTLLSMSYLFYCNCEADMKEESDLPFLPNHCPQRAVQGLTSHPLEQSTSPLNLHIQT